MPLPVAGTTTSGSFFGVRVAMSIFGYAASIVAAVGAVGEQDGDAAAAEDDVVGGEHGAGVGNDYAGPGATSRW